MPRKKKPRKAIKKDESQQILDDAEQAGIRYAGEQTGSDHFMNWVGDQMTEAKEMQRRDPSSVFPIETKADRKKLARNMLQQLEWDTKRQLGADEILELTGTGSEIGAETWDRTARDIKREIVSAFYKGFNEALHEDALVNWLAGEIEAINEGFSDTGAEEVSESAARKPFLIRVLELTAKPPTNESLIAADLRAPRARVEKAVATLIEQGDVERRDLEIGDTPQLQITQSGLATLRGREPGGSLRRTDIRTEEARRHVRSGIGD